MRVRKEKLIEQANSATDEQKEKIKEVRSYLIKAQKEQPVNLREHLQTFNDGVMAILITIIVLDIKPPFHEVGYQHFIAQIIVFLISFFIIADFWYELHLSFSYFIFKPSKRTAIFDFCFLADIALLPVMTKWIMSEDSSFAVANYGLVFLIAQIFKLAIQYSGSKDAIEDDDLRKKFLVKRTFGVFGSILFLNVCLIILAFFLPQLSMLLYLAIPIISLIKPRGEHLL